MKLKIHGVPVDIPEDEVEFYLHVGYEKIKGEEKIVKVSVPKKRIVHEKPDWKSDWEKE